MRGIGTASKGYWDRVLWILGQSLRDIGTQFNLRDIGRDSKGYWDRA